MTDMTDFATAAQAVNNPTTPAADLALIAQNHPQLRQMVAQHPNVYPGLSQWLAAQTPVAPQVVPQIPAPQMAPQMVPQMAPQPIPIPQMAPMMAPAPAWRPPNVAPSPAQPGYAYQPAPRVAGTPPAGPPKKGHVGLIVGLVSALVVLVVAALVITLVVLPRARQTKADHDAAVAAFNTASDDCASNATALASAISDAQTKVSVDPGTLLDSSVINKLNQAIASAQSTPSCNAPAMASDTASINQQASDLQQSAADLSTATDSVNAAAQAVTDSASALTSKLTAGTVATIVMTDNSGNQVKVTLNLTDWIKGTQTSWLNRAWSINGGQGTMPAVSNNYDLYDGGGSYYFDGPNAIYAIGTVTYDAVTSDITGFGSAGGGGDSGYAGSSLTGSPGDQFTCINYSSPQCYVDGPLAEPALTSNHWGPVTVVLAFDNYPSDPSTMALTLETAVGWINSPDSDTFTLGTTW